MIVLITIIMIIIIIITIIITIMITIMITILIILPQGDARTVAAAPVDEHLGSGTFWEDKSRLAGTQKVSPSKTSNLQGPHEC